MARNMAIRIFQSHGAPARRRSVSNGFPKCTVATLFLDKVCAPSLDPPNTSPTLKIAHDAPNTSFPNSSGWQISRGSVDWRFFNKYLFYTVDKHCVFNSSQNVSRSFFSQCVNNYFCTQRCVNNYWCTQQCVNNYFRTNCAILCT